METTSSDAAVAATLRAPDVKLSGVLFREGSWMFSPVTPLDRHERIALLRAAELRVSWGEREQGAEVDVELGRLTSEEITLRPVGEPRRNQRRMAVRAPLHVRCHVLIAGPDQLVVRSGETIDISAGGAATLTFSRDTSPGADPGVGATVGVVFEFDEHRIPVVAQVMGVRLTDARRTVLRLRFDQVRRSDSDEIHRHVLKSEREHAL